MRLLLFLLLFYGCTQSNSLKNHTNELPTITEDSLMQYAKKEFEIIELEQKRDTLLIVSTNKVLFYPFGEYAIINDFKDGYINQHDLKVIIDSSFNIFSMFTIKNDISIVILLENTETERLELFKADIRDNSLELFYGIRIGMTKDDVFLRFFVKTPPGVNHIRTIKIASGLEGIWYYFNFSTKGQLENAIIESDYILNSSFASKI